MPCGVRTFSANRTRLASMRSKVVEGQRGSALERRPPILAHVLLHSPATRPPLAQHYPPTSLPTPHRLPHPPPPPNLRRAPWSPQPNPRLPLRPHLRPRLHLRLHPRPRPTSRHRRSPLVFLTTLCMKCKCARSNLKNKISGTCFCCCYSVFGHRHLRGHSAWAALCAWQERNAGV